MFLKPFRVKSNSQIKGSDRKKLRTQLLAAFPSLTAEDCSALIPTKEEVSVSRLVTHGGATVTCYLCGREPLLLQVDARLVPTLYTLWRYPDMVPTLTTYAPVVSKLRGGADLMLPGVICDLTAGVRAYPRLQKGDPVAVNTDANAAPSAVGRAARSSDDLYMMAGRGKAVLLMHVVGDQLWDMGSRQPPPELGPPPLPLTQQQVAAEAEQEADGTEREQEQVDGTEQEQVVGPEPAAGEAGQDASGPPSPPPPADTAVPDVQTLTLDGDGDGSGPQAADEKPPPPPPLDMDQLMRMAFLQAWRTSARRLELPVLVSNFYAQHMRPSSTQPLDVKKSSYKKISKFLEQMERDGLVQVKELAKGVQSIVSVAMEHPEIRLYRVQPVCRDEAPSRAEAETDKTDKGHGRSKAIESIEELFVVSGNVAAIFKYLNIAKGTPLAAQRVRAHLTEYVKKKELQDQNDKGRVTLDPVLAGCLTQRSDGLVESVRWDELHQRCLQRMSPGHVVTFVGEPPQLKKGTVPSVELTTITRSGNKKVTMVLNLPVFGIDPAEFAHRCQVGVAASTSVGEAPHRPPGTSQVMVQGNQITFISRLLQDDYKVPKKYIKGLEKAPKKRP